MLQKYTYSIDEFCRLHNIGRTTFYNLLKNGIAPDVMKIGRKTLISVEAAEKWRNSQSKIVDVKNKEVL